MSLAWTIARRELRGGLRGFRVFLACLALGVAAIAAVGLVRAAIQQGLSDQGAVLLGGDAQMEFTYRFATEDERAWMEGVGDRVSEIVDFRSMVVVGEETARLLEMEGYLHKRVVGQDEPVKAIARAVRRARPATWQQGRRPTL